MWCLGSHYSGSALAIPSYQVGIVLHVCNVIMELEVYNAETSPPCVLGIGRLISVSISPGHVRADSYLWFS